MLRASGIGVLGLGGAALIGCGDGDGGDGGTTTPPTGSTAPSTGTTGSTGTGWYEGERSPGFDPALGMNPVNEKEHVPGGTYTRAYRDTTRQQDVDLSAAGADIEMTGDRLTRANGWTQEIIPDLLESWEVADDGLAIVMHLRPGIKTHDRAPTNGRIFTAEDVAYSMERKAGLLDPVEALKYPRHGQYIGMDRAEVVDDVTVKIVFNTPNSAVMSVLSDPRAEVFPREMDEIGWKDPMKSVGTGAWIQTEHVEGTRQVYQPHPDYYRTAAEGGRASFDTYEKLILADRSSEIAAFLTGQISQLNSVQPHEESQIEGGASDAIWYQEPNFGWNYFAGSMKLPFMQDERVRKAIHYSIDFEAMGSPYGDWLYSGPHHVMYAESHTSDEIKAMFPYNPDTKAEAIAEAVKMMDAAGYPGGAGIKYEMAQGSGAGLSYDTAVRLQEQWRKVLPGIEVDVTVYSDYATFTNLLATRTSQARVAHHTMAPNAAVEVRTYYHTDGSRNYSQYSTPWADELADKILHEGDFETRKGLVRDFEDRYIDEGAPHIPLVVTIDKTAIQGNVGGADLVNGPWAYGIIGGYGVGPRWYWQTK